MKPQFNFQRLLSIMVTGRHYTDPAQENLTAIWFDLFDQLHQCIPYDVTTRLLSGYEPGIEQASVQKARALDWEIQLLLTHKISQTPGLETSQDIQAIQKIVSLGRDMSEHDLIPSPIQQRDQIGIHFTDLLVVYWDSEANNNDQHTTLKLINQAAQSRKAVIWLNPQGQIFWLQLELLDDATLQLLNASDYSPEALLACFKPVSSLKETPLTSFIELLLNPCLQTNNPNAQLLLELTDTERNRENLRDTGRVHTLMSGLLHSDQKGNWARLKQKLSAYRHPKMESKPPKDVQQQPSFNNAFAIHDFLAEQAGGLHRSNIWLLYGFAALAVLVAVSAEVWKLHWLVYIELGLIASVLYRVWWARKINLHQTWIRHRYLAEQMRYCIMGYPALAIPAAFLEPVWQVNNAKQLQLNHAEHWLLQRHLITSGLPCDENKVYTPPYHNHVLAEHIQAGVRNQMQYHQMHHHEKHIGHRRLHFLAELQFLLTFIAVVIHLYVHENWLLLFTAALPAFAAALHGILTKLEMERISSQSASLYQQLNQLDQALDRYLQATPIGDDGWHHWVSLHYLANKSQQTMSDNISQWQQLIQVQRTEIPA